MKMWAIVQNPFREWGQTYVSAQIWDIGVSLFKCQMPKLECQRKSKCQNAKAGEIQTLLLAMEDRSLWPLDFGLVLTFGL